MSIERYRSKRSASALSRQDYAKRIKAALGKSVVGFIEAGQELIQAQDDLVQHGEWDTLVETDLGMDRSTAFRLMAIAKHPVLSNVAHAQHFPPSGTRSIS